MEFDRNTEKQYLACIFQKIQAITDETKSSIWDCLNKAIQYYPTEFLHLDIPADFDPIAYLILNPDVLFAGDDPIHHFIHHGKQEERSYRSPEINSSENNVFVDQVGGKSSKIMQEQLMTSEVTPERTLFIHAGGAKTGTSALQNYFEINASQLENIGFAYKNRLNIKSEYEITPGNGMLLYKSLCSTTCVDIDALVLSYFGRCDNAICSSEFFSDIDAYNWKRLIKSTERLGISLKVVFYVRNVLPFFLSSYDQNIKRSGECRPFDEWVEKATWEHARTLRVIRNELHPLNVKVRHYDKIKGDLIRSFLDILGIHRSFYIDSTDHRRQVNRSLTNEERDILITLNKAGNMSHCSELSDLFVYTNPNIQEEMVLCNNKTIEALLVRFSNDVDWINTNFFDSQAITSVLSSESVKKFSEKKAITESVHHHNAINIAINWGLEKIKTVKEEICCSIWDTLNKSTQYDAAQFHRLDIPADFDPIAYLILNPDVLFAGDDPVHHFIHYGCQDGRRYSKVDPKV
ncbi:MAG: hypothetical protein K9K84_11035 [Methylovulum sp.]|nr:hypothetical protein [Methylovulum sp.]